LVNPDAPVLYHDSIRRTVLQAEATPFAADAIFSLDIRYYLISGHQHVKQFAPADLAVRPAELYLQSLLRYATERGLSGCLSPQQELDPVDQIGGAVGGRDLSQQIDRSDRMWIDRGPLWFLP
jgi:hypothetical protein